MAWPNSKCGPGFYFTQLVSQISHTAPGFSKILACDVAETGLVVVMAPLPALRDSTLNTDEKQEKCFLGFVIDWAGVHRTVTIKMCLFQWFEV